MLKSIDAMLHLCGIYVNTGCSLYDNNRKINVQWYGADRLETFIRGI